MKKCVRYGIFALLLALLCVCVVSCTPPENPKPGPGDESLYKILISPDTGATVEGVNPVMVAEGMDVTFKVSIKNGYWFSGIDAENAFYDEATQILTVSDVKENQRIAFRTEELGYDTDQTFIYRFEGTTADSSNLVSGTVARAGTPVTVRAGDLERVFVGWSYTRGGEVVSANRLFTFRIDPENAKGNVLCVYPLYKDGNRYYYDANGGTVNTGSHYMNGSAPHIRASYHGIGGVQVVMDEEYMALCECASTFWDDGTFRRDGYVLKEYNTKADGTGTAYSLGSKFYHETGEPDTFATLYCIWEPEAPAVDFTYTISGDGVRIDSYIGTAAGTLAVPGMIEGKRVIAIAKGAFRSCSFSTLILPHHLQNLADGAFENCTALHTLYFPDSVTKVSNHVMDEATYTNFRHFYLSGTTQPRAYSGEWDSMAIKLSRLLASRGKRVIYVAGSSAYEGISSPFFDTLLGEEYTFINFGTVRTINGAFILEAMQAYTREGDTVVYAPENSAMVFGEKYLSWKTFSLLHGMYNLYRNVDISAYENVFGAYAEDRAKTRGSSYEEMVVGNASVTNRYGDAISHMDERNRYPKDRFYARYYDSYYITLNDRVMSRFEGEWNSVSAEERKKEYLNPDSVTWCTITDAYYRDAMNRSIDLVRATGAKVCFGFCPTEADAIADEAYNLEWMRAYDKLIADTYHFDSVLGTCADYVLNYNYFYNCAFHTSSMGRTYHTYQSYRDVAAFLRVSAKGIYDEGYNFEGCYFERTALGTPQYSKPEIPEKASS